MDLYFLILWLRIGDPSDGVVWHKVETPGYRDADYCVHEAARIRDQLLAKYPKLFGITCATVDEVSAYEN